MSYFKSKNAPSTISAGAPHQTPPGELNGLDLREPTSKRKEWEGKGKGGVEGRRSTFSLVYATPLLRHQAQLVFLRR